MIITIAFTISIVFNFYFVYKITKLSEQYKNEKIKFTATKDYVEHLTAESNKAYADLANKIKKNESSKKSK